MLPFDELWDGLSGVVLRTGLPVRSRKGGVDSRQNSAVRTRRERDQAGSILVVPIQSGTIVGTLTAINALDERDFTDRDLALLTALASQAAIAIERATLLTKLHQQATVDEFNAVPMRRTWFEQSQQYVAMAETIQPFVQHNPARYRSF